MASCARDEEDVDHPRANWDGDGTGAAAGGSEARLDPGGGMHMALFRRRPGDWKRRAGGPGALLSGGVENWTPDDVRN